MSQLQSRQGRLWLPFWRKNRSKRLGEKGIEHRHLEPAHPGGRGLRAGSVKRVASAVGEGSVVVSAIWTALDTHHGADRAAADQQQAKEHA